MYSCGRPTFLFFSDKTTVRPKTAAADRHSQAQTTVNQQKKPHQTGYLREQNMTKTRRWLTSAIAESKKEDVRLPWARSAGRSEWRAGVAARVTEHELKASA